jgi:predicted small lipoprotein YifL
MGIRTARRDALSDMTCDRPLAVCRAAAGLAAIASLAACGTSTPTVTLPPKQSSAPAATASSSGAPASAKQAVIDAYLAFWPESSQAEKTGNATKARAILAPYVVSAYISYMISGMQSAWAEGEVSWGTTVEHIQSVTVATLNSGERTAVVRDCQNDSDSGLANARTGALVAGTLGSAEQELYTSMGLVNGHWLIEQVTFVGDTCTG